MEIDYDDMCNGLNEWRNVAPIVRQTLFCHAQDTLAVKQHVIELSKRLAEVEHKQSEQLKQVQQVSAQQNDGTRLLQLNITKKFDELEEKLLEGQFAQKQQQELTKNQLEAINIVRRQHDQLEQVQLQQAKQQEQQAQSIIGAVKDVQAKADPRKLEQVVVNQIQNLKIQFDDQINQIQQDIGDFQLGLQKLQQSLTKQPKAAPFDPSPLKEEIAAETQQLLNETLKNFATKQVLQQIGAKMNEKLLQISEQQGNVTVSPDMGETKLQLFELQRRIKLLEGDGQAMPDSTRIALMEKQVRAVSESVSHALDSIQKTVTVHQLDEQISDVKLNCSKQISEQVSQITEINLFRQVKSVVRAEIDQQKDIQKREFEQLLGFAQQDIVKKIQAQINPEQSMQLIERQCDDIRKLIELVGGDVDFKLQKYREEQYTTLQGELGAVRQSLDAMNGALSTQSDVVSCRLRDYDQFIANSNGVTVFPTARWTWKTKKLTTNQAVVWSAEESNTLQSNFVWERGKSQVLVVQAGCYKIEYVIFARKRPSVQLVVNNECFVNSLCNGGTTIYTVPKAAAAGCYFGQTHIDYLYLSQNTVVQVVIGSEFQSCISGYMVLTKQW